MAHVSAIYPKDNRRGWIFIVFQTPCFSNQIVSTGARPPNDQSRERLHLIITRLLAFELG